MAKVNFPQLGQIIDVKPGTRILDVAIEYDLPLQHVCGGCCACTTCRVEIAEGIENCGPMEADEAELVETLEMPDKKMRLGCQCKINGDMTVLIQDL